MISYIISVVLEAASITFFLYESTQMICLYCEYRGLKKELKRLKDIQDRRDKKESKRKEATEK